MCYGAVIKAILGISRVCGVFIFAFTTTKTCPFNPLVLFHKLIPQPQLCNLLLKVGLRTLAVCVTPVGRIQPDLNMSDECTVPCPACHRYCGCDRQTGRQTARRLRTDRWTKDRYTLKKCTEPSCRILSSVPVKHLYRDHISLSLRNRIQPICHLIVISLFTLFYLYLEKNC